MRAACARTDVMRLLPSCAFLVAIGVSSVARGESIDPERDLVCPLEIAPMHEAHVPLNAPALIVMFDRDGDRMLHPALDIGPLRTPSGAFIELEQTREDATNALLLRSPEALTEGEHEIVIQMRCPNATKAFDKGPKAIPWKLVVDPAVSFPKTIGTAYAEQPDEDGDGHVVVELSPELAAFREVARLVVEIQRQPSSAAQRYGDIPERDGLVRLEVSRYGCLPEQMDGEVHPVPVFMNAHIAGALEDPEPLGIEAQVRCARAVESPGPAAFPQPNAASVDGACGCRTVARTNGSHCMYLTCIIFGAALFRRTKARGLNARSRHRASTPARPG